jgi:hypothetical protein
MAARIAFLSIARTTFDIPLATEVSNSAREKLSAAGFKVEGHPGLLTDLELAKAAAHEIAQNPPDLLIALQATFADSTMMVALAEKINAPMLMWAIPEARTGGRLRLNSLCGINLAAHALTLRKKKYHYLYTQPDDPEAIKHIAALANAGNVARQLKRTTIGVVGEHPDRFDVTRADNKHLGFGVGIHFCLGAPLARIEAPIAINEMLRRLPDLRLATEKVERMPDIAMRGLKSLPVTFG